MGCRLCQGQGEWAHIPLTWEARGRENRDSRLVWHRIRDVKLADA